ncbi:MAG TPA: hypothetical protein DCQ31_02750 [Bacteroidales bacterium]|nr:hypothetical protein [Bacteroidales bacterium]
MRTRANVQIAALFTLLTIVASSCINDKGTYTILRKYIPGTFITEEDAELRMAAKKDTAVRVKITDVSVEGFFTELSESVVQHGHVWSTDSNKLTLEAGNFTELGEMPKGYVGKFLSELTELTSETQYYIRSYVRTSKNQIGYNPVFAAFKTRPTENEWRIRNQLDAVGRTAGVVFVSGGYAYVGMGEQGLSAYVAQIWKYSQASNTWDSFSPHTSIGSKPGDFQPRRNAVAFTVGTKGYIGLGENVNGDILSDFWEIDLEKQTWIQIKGLGNGDNPRINAVAFALGNKGYVGLGEFGNPSDKFWSYNQITKNWSSDDIKPFGGGERTGAIAFVLGGRAYVGLGKNYMYDDDGNKTTLYYNDLWEYNAEFDTWTQRQNFPGDGRTGAIGFSIEDEGFVGMGTKTVGGVETLYSDFYMFDPYNSKWIQKKSLDYPRKNSVGFSIGTKGYVAWGYGPFQGGDPIRLWDVWEYSR